MYGTKLVEWLRIEKHMKVSVWKMIGAAVALATSTKMVSGQHAPSGPIEVGVVEVTL